MNNLSAKPDWANKSYLVIDDFSIVHRMLRDMLRKLGARAIDTVKNGTDAIALLRQKQYDVVLCDYNFSEGPNGQQILEEARHRELIGLTCIWMMVSSEKAVETVMGAAEQAPDGYILKPLTESLLLARLNRAWDRKQAFTAIERAYAVRNYLQAAQLCDQGLANTPLHAMDLLRMKANLLLKAEQPQAARKVYEQALELRDQVWAKAGLARIDTLEGRHADAKRRLMEIVRDHPSFLDGYDQLAQSLQLLGETAQALEVLEQAARLSPYSVMRQKNLGDVASQLGKFDIAEEAYQTSIAVGEYSILKSPEAYLGLAQLYGRTGRFQDAQALLATVRQSFADEQIVSRAAAIQSQIATQPGEAAKPAPNAPETSRPIQHKATQTTEWTGISTAKGVPAPDEAHRTASQQASVVKRAEPSPPAQMPAPMPQPIPAVPAKETLVPEYSTPKPVATTAAGINRPVEKAADNFGMTAGAGAGVGAEAVAAATAAPAIPAPAQALYQRAQVLMQYMKTNGYNLVSAEEVRAVLRRAEKIAPGIPRTQELLFELDKMGAGRN